MLAGGAVVPDCDTRRKEGRKEGKQEGRKEQERDATVISSLFSLLTLASSALIITSTSEP